MDVDRLFAAYRNAKIALYGLGTETERALRNLENDHEIVGLLDSFREEGELYGKRIISFHDAVEADVKLIIVVARPGSCRAIAKRIGMECRKSGIALMDIRGKSLLEAAKVSYDFSKVSGVIKAELREKTRQADVVSFDLFDTLVMRRTLYSDDVAGYVDCRLREQGFFIEDFCSKRLESEKELSKHMTPTLTEIYGDMLGKSDGDSHRCNMTARQLAELEWNIDFKLIIPRREVCDIFRETVKSGKKVYVVSDTYYSKGQLAQILEKCGITEYADILASSDYGIGKTQGLYRVLKDREKSKKHLHIGDDIVADIEYARKFGIEAYRLLSGLDLLESVGNLGLADDADSLSGHLKTGMFVSRIFNSPFQFEHEDKRITIHDAYEIGYLFCAPMVSDFVLWFQEQMEKGQFQNVWFSARDGYLIQKMYRCLLAELQKQDKSVYFLTSRTAAVRAGVQDENDIRYVDGMRFGGTLEENLKERFGIDAASVKNKDISKYENSLMKYRNAILEQARSARVNYKKYINGLNVTEGNIAFFDFVAKGTVQMYIQRLVGKHLNGFYFLQLEKEYMKDRDLNVHSFYENEEPDSCAVYEDYYILETLLTAPQPSVTGFDENGEAIYAAETRTEKNIRCIEQAQQGILDYFKAYVRFCPKSRRMTDKKLDGCFLELIHRFRITDMDFLDMVVEDSFFNRMTNITDVL